MTKLISRTTLLFALLASLIACVGSPIEKNPEAVEQAYKSLSAGVSNYNKSNYSLAQSHFSTALRIFRSIDHREGTASSCLNIAKVHLERNELVLAQDYLTIAENIIKDSALNNLNSHLAITKSSLAIAKNDYEKAKLILDPLMASNQSTPIKLAALQNRIRIAFSENDIDEARSLTRNFATTLQSAGKTNTTYQARLFRFQGALSSDSTETDKNFKQALTIYRQHTHRPGIASTLNEWGEYLLVKNEFATAKDKLLRALYIRQSIEDKAGSIRLLESLNKAYKGLDSTDMSKLTETWINKINEIEFKQWNQFIDAFNAYPAK